MEAIATRLEAIATRLEAIATRLEAIVATRLEAIATRLEAIATRKKGQKRSSQFSCLVGGPKFFQGLYLYVYDKGKMVLVASLLLVVRPGAPSSVRTLLVAMPFAPSSVLTI